MPLFDIIKYPERAQAVEPPPPEEPTVIEPEDLSELEALRASARAADARAQAMPEFAMDALAEMFLSKCLAQAHQSSLAPYRHDPDIEEGFREALRIVGVTVLTGDWATVLNGRESALAVVVELRRRGYEAPCHDYRQVAGMWELRIRFSF